MKSPESIEGRCARIAAIDQARGYAILGMILVNVLGHFDVMPWMLKHHREGFSYADHIAPLFLFIVGMGFRLSFLRRAARDGLQRARRDALRRYLILCALGLVYGFFDFKVSVWDALLDIGMAGLLALPFMHLGRAARLAAGVALLTLYQTLFSCTPYGAWVMGHSINGGPLGPLSWAFILLAGTVAWDLVATARPQRIIRGCLAGTLLFSAAGWALRAPWPGLKPLWPFTQYGMTAPYPLYAAGLCFLTVLVFYLACDQYKLRFPHLSVLGYNPLVIYILQALLVLVAGMTVPDSAPWPVALGTFITVYACCYGVAFGLFRGGRSIRL
jgi:predicted acyltransferase